jgi:uncharacterized protein DUF3592
VHALRVVVFFLVAGLLLAAVGWKEWRVHRAIQAGSRAEAVVVGRGDCPGWQSCTPAETAVSVAFRLPDGTPRGASVTVEKKEKHPIGSRLYLRYDPHHPNRAEYVNHGSRAFGALVAGVLFVFGSVAFGALYAVKPYSAGGAGLST